MATPEPRPAVPRAFISYSWDDDAHRDWVRQLAIRLRADGVNVTLDRWHAEPGDQIPAFMEHTVRENDFVIAVCTPRFKERSDGRDGGVGYEGDIMTAYAFTGSNTRKFIPVLRRGSWNEAAPTWLLGRARIDLSGEPYSGSEYEELLRTLHGAREAAPPIGPRPNFDDTRGSQASSAPAPVTPSNLPYRSIGSLFKGRDDFLKDLRARLLGPGGRAAAIVAPLALHGLGGVGKTRAAIEYAWRHADDYSALLFVSAPGVAKLRANLANLAGVFGAGQAGMPLEQHLAEVLRWLDDHPGWLLIIDNVDTEAAARGVEGLLASLRSGHVLITSRIGSWSAGVERLDLHVLAPGDAVAFLMERAANRRQAPDDATQAAAIARELDGLALALEQAAAYVEEESLSFAEYLQHWRDRRQAVLAWHDERLMQYPRSVAITWETTFERLPEPARRLLGVLAWLAPESIPLSLFDATPLVEAIPEPRKALGSLKRYSLARFDASGGSVLVHRLVQEIARRRGTEADGQGILRIALETVVSLAPFEADDVRTWDVWAPLAPHADVVARFADAVGLPEPTARLMNQLGLYWQARGLVGPAEPLYRRALAIGEAIYGPDHPYVAAVLNNLAALLRATGRVSEAEPLHRRALAIGEAIYGPDHPDVATALNNLGLLLPETGRLSEAEPLHRRALAIDESTYGPDHPAVARDLNNLAGLLRATGRVSEAEPLHRRCLQILLDFQRRTGHQHPNFRVGWENYVSLLASLGKTLEQIEQHLDELVRSPLSEGS